MIPTFQSLQQRRDEYEMLRLVREWAETVLDENTDFVRYRVSQFRVANNEVRIFEDGSSPSLRSWLVTFNVAANQYVVLVQLKQPSEEWNATLVRWEITVHGLYYIKVPAPWTYDGAYLKLDVWSNSAYYHTDEHREPIGEAELVGHTQEPIPRAVYWLFDQRFPSPALRRQVSGNYVLNDRRFQSLPETMIIMWIGM